jgi:hypothetical protein
MNFDKDTGVFDKDLDDDLEVETTEVVAFSDPLDPAEPQAQANKRKNARGSQHEVEIRRTVEDIIDQRRQRSKYGDDLFDDFE